MSQYNQTLSALTRSISSFPALPAVVARVMDLTSNPESSVEDLMDVIQCDPALTTMVLKLSNSAYFGQVRRVSSLKQSISVLGIDEIRNIVVAKAMFQSFKHLDNEGLFDIRNFWFHSFMCGLCARIISRDVALLENFFIYGLIHDIGKLVFLTALPSKFLETIKDHGHDAYTIFQQEEKSFGITHAEIGMVLLKRWMFPEQIVSTVGYHHCPEKADKKDIFPYIIYFADILTYLDGMKEKGIPDHVFTAPHIAKRANAAMISWNRESVNGFLETLDTLKGEAHEAFSLIYS